MQSWGMGEVCKFSIGCFTMSVLNFGSFNQVEGFSPNVLLWSFGWVTFIILGKLFYVYCQWIHFYLELRFSFSLNWFLRSMSNFIKCYMWVDKQLKEKCMLSVINLELLVSWFANFSVGWSLSLTRNGCVHIYLIRVHLGDERYVTCHVAYMYNPKWLHYQVLPSKQFIPSVCQKVFLPRASVFDPKSSPFSFKVQHECFGRCEGLVLPEAYTSPSAR